MSVFIEDSTTSNLNGSFESQKDGLPVNWQLYTPQTVPNSNFTIMLDTNNSKAGKQSLQFNVVRCAETGGWQSPGMAKEIDAKPGDAYTVSFWIKNNGATFIAKIGGITATKHNLKTIVATNENSPNWKQYYYKFTMPPHMDALRFELNVIQPGIVWIDDVRIEKEML